MKHRQEERIVADAQINWSSIMLASVSAGPLFFLGIGIGMLISDPATPVSIYMDWRIGLAVPIVAMFAAIFGAVIAFLPNLIGAALMTSMGNRYEAARSPVLWMLAGGLAGAVAMTAGAGSSGVQSVNLIALTFTGACCALICRRRAEW